MKLQFRIIERLIIIIVASDIFAGTTVGHVDLSSRSDLDADRKSSLPRINRITRNTVDQFTSKTLGSKCKPVHADLARKVPNIFGFADGGISDSFWNRAATMMSSTAMNGIEDLSVAKLFVRPKLKVMGSNASPSSLSLTCEGVFPSHVGDTEPDLTNHESVVKVDPDQMNVSIKTRSLKTKSILSATAFTISQFAANNSARFSTDDVVINVNSADGTNQAPIVNAGPDQAIIFPAAAMLSGTATDDGLPTGGTLTKSWSKVSGPGTVVFVNATSLNATATFSTTGTYVLQLTASDGLLSSSSSVTIVVGSVVTGRSFYIRDGGTGSSCTDWGSNACDQLPSMSAITRGDTIYFAGGNYNMLILDKPVSGSTVITIKPATIADHGTSTGWSDSFGTQPSIAGARFDTGYWTVDGRTRNESDWAAGSAYGLHFSGQLYSSSFDPGNYGPCADNITIKYSDIGGADVGNVFDASDPAGIYMLGIDTDTCSNWVIQRNRIHNTNLAIMLNGATNATVEYNRIGPAWSKEAIRGNNISSGHIIRYNYFQDSCQFRPGDNTSTCTGEIAIWGSMVASAYDNIKIYGNVIRVTTSEQHTGGAIIVGGDNSSWYGIGANNVEVYNNTVAGIQSSQAGILVNGSPSNICKNNLFYANIGTPTARCGTSSSNGTVASGSAPLAASS